MSNVFRITKSAERAINESLTHYFGNLAYGEGLKSEVGYLVELLKNLQGWLLFTETSQEEIQTELLRDSLRVNLVYTLTALFNARFVVTDMEYASFVDHIAKSFNIQACSTEEMLLMPKQYSERLMDFEGIKNILMNNKWLVMLTCFYLYVDTAILEQAGGDKK